MARLAAHKDEQIAELVSAYDDLTFHQRAEPGLLERLSLAVGLHPAEFFGRVSAVAYRHNYEVATFIASIKVKEILERSAEFAMDKDGFKDRELVAKVARVMPEQGPLVQVNTQVNTQVAAGLPPVEGITGRVSELVRENPDEPKALEAEFSVAEDKSSP